MRSLQEKMCEKTSYAVKSRWNILLSEFLYGKSWNFIFLGRFRFSAGFGHLPKYYLPIIALSHFTKVFSLQNFVLYGMWWMQWLKWTVWQKGSLNVEKSDKTQQELATTERYLYILTKFYSIILSVIGLVLETAQKHSYNMALKNI